MKREPTMHIKLEDFAEILKSEGIKNYKQLAIKIFTKAVKYNVKDRYVITAGAELRGKLKKVVEANKDVSIPIEKFNLLLVDERRKVGHRSILPIRLGDSNYVVLKEVCQLAIDFCKEFQYESYTEGIRVFLSLGIEFMVNKYSLAKFKSVYLGNRIRDRVSALQALSEDPDKAKTVMMKEHWELALIKQFGVEMKVRTPEDHYDILLGRREADDQKASYVEWIDAIIAGAVMRNYRVSPSALHGDYAVVAYRDYITTRSQHVKKEAKEVVREFKSSFKERYEQSIKNKK